MARKAEATRWMLIKIVERSVMKPMMNKGRSYVRSGFPVKTPVPAENGWDTSASKVTLYCDSCWWRRRKRQCVATRLAPSVPTPGDASRTPHRHSGDGTQTRGSVDLMWRNGWEYSQTVEFGSYAGQLVTGHSVNQSTVHLMAPAAP